MRTLIVLLVVFFVTPFYGQQQVMIDSGNSVINWEGSDLLGLNKHHGTVKFRTGTLTRNGTAVTGGSFEINMNSIVNTDGEYSKELISHLKNADFFDVKKYPVSKLDIMHVQYLNAKEVDVLAYLTINSIRKIIKYPAVITTVDGEIVMKSKFTIDRTLWKINYKSKSILSEITKNVISDNIEFDVIVKSGSEGC